MADVIIEKDSDETRRSGNNMGVIVGVVALVILVLLVLFLLPSLMGGNADTVTPQTAVPSATSAP